MEAPRNPHGPSVLDLDPAAGSLTRNTARGARSTDGARHRDLVVAVARAATRLDVRTTESLLQKGHDALGWWGLCSEILGPAARLTGDWWIDDECSFVDVTIGVGLLQQFSHRFSPERDGRAPSRGRILLSAAPGAQHTFGLLLKAEQYGVRGWTVEIGWPFAPPRFDDRELQAIGLSVSGPRDFAWARDLAERLERTRPDMPLLLGGAGATDLEEEAAVHTRGLHRLPHLDLAASHASA